MQKKRTDFGYWMGWYVSFGIAAVFFVVAILHTSWLQDTACLADISSSECIAGMLAKLVGAAAAIGAALTLIALWKQTLDAAKHHKNSTKIQLRKSRALVKRTLAAARRVRGLCEMYIRFWTSPGTHWHLMMDHQLNHLSKCAAELVFSNFELEIDVLSPMSMEQLKLELEAHTTVHRANTSNYLIGLSDFNNACNKVIRVMIDIEKSCISYLSDTNEMMGRDANEAF